MQKGPIVILLALLIGLTGCRPKGVLSSRQMRGVLYDLHRADGVIYVAKMETGYDEALARCYQSVLDKHGVTQAEFDSSLVWYTDNPALFDKIYPKVMHQLDKDIIRLEAIQASRRKRREIFQQPWSAGIPYDWQVVMFYLQDTVPTRSGPLDGLTYREWMLQMTPKMPE